MPLVSITCTLFCTCGGTNISFVAYVIIHILPYTNLQYGIGMINMKNARGSTQTDRYNIHTENTKRTLGLLKNSF